MINFAVTGTYGDVIGGWSLEPLQLRIGFTRLIYPFFAGLLLSRICKPGKIKYAFLWSSVITISALVLPRVGGSDHLWVNGLYDSFTIIVIFPLIVYIGASGDAKGRYSSKICKFFGDISYPIYITHFTLIYIYTAWVSTHNIQVQNVWPIGQLILFLAMTIVYVSLKLYDLPVRKWLAKKLLFNGG